MSEEQKKSASSSTPAKQPGFFLNAANWLLSRLPWFRDRYEQWSHGKRIFIGLLMYLVVLPIIPIVIGIIMFVRDPEGFKKSKAMPILGVVIAAWFGAFGLVAMQPSKVTENAESTAPAAVNKESKTNNTTSTAKDTSDTQTATKSDAKKSVESKAKSEPTGGATFENCDAAFKAGVFDIPKSDPSYADKLDGDNDGIACEK